MAIKTINRVNSKDNGKTNEVCCPVCGKTVSMRLFENIDISGLSLFLGKNTSDDFAVCPACASIFTVNENYLKEFKNGTTCYITPEDLNLLKENKKIEK